MQSWKVDFSKAVSFTPSDDSLYNYMENTVKQRLSVEEAMFYWLQIREAVEYLHNRRIIHKDIKGKIWQHFVVQAHVGCLSIIWKWLPWQGKKILLTRICSSDMKLIRVKQ